MRLTIKRPNASFHIDCQCFHFSGVFFCNRKHTQNLRPRIQIKDVGARAFKQIPLDDALYLVVGRFHVVDIPVVHYAVRRTALGNFTVHVGIPVLRPFQIHIGRAAHHHIAARAFSAATDQTRKEIVNPVRPFFVVVLVLGRGFLCRHVVQRANYGIVFAIFILRNGSRLGRIGREQREIDRREQRQRNASRRRPFKDFSLLFLFSRFS